LPSRRKQQKTARHRTGPPVAIEVIGARTHNLDHIDCSIPHGRVTVVTGPSGAGKSSLAFDTVFAEGQRRFVESMSTYARQFLDQMERPPVDDLRNVLPAVALVASNSIKNARSTVGTITEAHDVLRLLYTHLGEVSCPHGHGPARTFTPEQAAADLEAGAAGGRFTLLARVARAEGRADRAAAALGELIRQGFSRRLDEATGEVVRMEPGARWPKALDPLPLVLGRFRAGPDTTARVTATVEEAYRLGRGRAEALGEPAAAGDAPAVRYYARELGCPVCGETLRRPSPALFSFNSPLGACDTCQGFGRLIGIDRERVVPDPGKSLAERPIAPWNTPAYEELYDDLLTAARRRRLPLDRPWRELSDEERQWVWSGEGDFVNLDDFFAWLEQRTYKVHVRVLLARYRAYEPCPDCGGTRL
jgi:excinuclease ABC subunit A